MNGKIKELLSAKNLTPSRFADEIGVQRSSISHILSGRNKPSLEIIQKIMKRFPELGTDWLLEESAPVKPEGNDRKYFQGPEKPEVPPSLHPFQPDIKPEQEKTESELHFPRSSKRIERILVFYSDNTFSEYIPFESQKQA